MLQSVDEQTTRLREILEAGQVDKKRFARIAGFSSVSVLDAMLRGDRGISKKVLETIANHFPHLSVRYLLTGQGSPIEQSPNIELFTVEGLDGDRLKPIGFHHMPGLNGTDGGPLPAFQLRQAVGDVPARAILICEEIPPAKITLDHLHVIILKDGGGTLIKRIRRSDSEEDQPSEVLQIYNNQSKLPPQKIRRDLISRIFLVWKVVTMSDI